MHARRRTVPASRGGAARSDLLRRALEPASPPWRKSDRDFVANPIVLPAARGVPSAALDMRELAARAHAREPVMERRRGSLTASAAREGLGTPAARLVTLPTTKPPQAA